MEATTPKKSRKWVIRTAIIFFLIMGVLVFFSQTIMNYSLPKVSSQYPGYGTIATSNRSTGTIEAASKTDIKAFDNRTVKEVFVYEYYEVQEGDLLMTLEPVTDSTELKDLKAQLETIVLNRYYNDKLPDNAPDYTSYEDSIDAAQTALDQATLDLANAKNKQTIITNAKSAKTAASTAIISLNAEIAALSETKTDLELELTEAQAVLAAAETDVDDIEAALAIVQGEIDSPDTDPADLPGLEAEKTALESDLADAQAALATAQTDVNQITTELATADSNLDSKSASLDKEQAKLEAAEAKLTESDSFLTVTVAEKNLTRAKKSLQDAKDALSDQKIIDGVDSEKEKKAREEEDKLIKELETKITDLETMNAITEIRAPISGLPTGFSFASGEQLTKDQYIGTITDPLGGFKASFTFTTQEAQTIYVGMDFGVNQWMADRVTVSQIRPDPSDPSGSRIVIATVEGQYLYSGTQIEIWFDDYSKQFECLVPNSAIYDDNGGKFVYVLKTKDSPLGERYIAEKVYVTVLATDGKSSALDPSVIQGRSIITRSEKPLENGQQVRLDKNQQEV